MEAGSAPDWITALVAVAALLAAIWAGLTSRSLLRVEMERNRVGDERDARDQASRIAAWTVYCPQFDGDGGKDGILVRNSSTNAVYDVIIHSDDRDGVQRPPVSMTVLPPGEFVLCSHPKYHWTFPMVPEEIAGPIRPITKHTGWVVRSLFFVDAQGATWKREGSILTRSGDR